MNRFAIACTSAALASTLLSAGCGKMNPPFEKKSPAGAVAKTPEQADYFEIKKDGKTYILGSNASRNALMSGTQPELKETPLDNGKTIYVENASYADYNRLVAEYKKSKGM